MNWRLTLSLRPENLTSKIALCLIAIAIVTIAVIGIVSLANNQFIEYWYKDRTRNETEYSLFLGSSSIARLPADKITQCQHSVIYGFENGIVEDIQWYLTFANLNHVKRVILYIGENDIAHGEHYQLTFKQLETIITQLLSVPQISISIMTIKPSPRRERVHVEFDKFNALLAEYLQNKSFSENEKERIFLIPFHTIDNPIYYAKDGVHLNDTGYDFLSLMINAICEET